MDSLLSGLFGGGDDGDKRSTQARDFVDRYEQGPIDQGYDENEAYEHFQQVSQHADPETMQRAAEQTFSRMDPQQREEFARMLQQQQGNGNMGRGMSHDPREMAGMVSQMHRQSPGGLASMFGGGRSSGTSAGGGLLGGLLGGGGGGGAMGGTLGKVAMGGIAAYAMKEIMGGGGGKDKKQRRSV